MVPEVVALARAMRAAGARVGTGEVEAAARALGVVSASREDAYLALRAVMCSRREDLAVFDAAFAEVFAGPGAGHEPPPFEMPPGVGETIAWAQALGALGADGTLDETLGVALKVREDLDRVRATGVLDGA